MQIRIPRLRAFFSGSIYPLRLVASATRRAASRAIGTGWVVFRPLTLGSLALACAVLLSACSHAATAPAGRVATVDPRPTLTPIPPVLRDYAQAVRPLMMMSSSEAAALVVKMRHDGLAVVGDECSAFGGDFQSAQATMRGTYTPPAAQAILQQANAGYRLLLVSTDECGMASDTNSKKEMTSAIRDLRTGLSSLNQAYARSKQWSVARS